jgi:hypothetical protein
MGLTRAGSVHAGHAERRGHQAEASKSARVADIPATVAGLDGSMVGEFVCAIPYEPCER